MTPRCSCSIVEDCLLGAVEQAAAGRRCWCGAAVGFARGLQDHSWPALIREHGSLDHLFADLNKVKSASTREKLLSARDQILQNRRMVELDCAMQLPVAIDDLRIKPDYAALIRALEECEFKSLLQEVRDEAVKAGASSQSSTSG